MGNEESLVGFPVKQVVPALVSKLFKTEHTSLGCKVNKTKLLTFYRDTEENCVAWSKILFTQHITWYRISEQSNMIADKSYLQPLTSETVLCIKC